MKEEENFVVKDLQYSMKENHQSGFVLKRQGQRGG